MMTTLCALPSCERDATIECPKGCKSASYCSAACLEAHRSDHAAYCDPTVPCMRNVGLQAKDYDATARQVDETGISHLLGKDLSVASVRRKRDGNLYESPSGRLAVRIDDIQAMAAAVGGRLIERTNWGRLLREFGGCTERVGPFAIFSRSRGMSFVLRTTDDEIVVERAGPIRAVVVGSAVAFLAG